MPRFAPFFSAAALFLLASALPLTAQEAPPIEQAPEVPAAPPSGETPLVLATEEGARATFTPSAEAPDQWTWTELVTAGGAEPRGVSIRRSHVRTSRGEDLLSPDWTLTQQESDRLVFEQDAPNAGVRLRRVFSFGPKSNVLRIATWIRTSGEGVVLESTGLLDLRVPGDSFAETGPVPTSFPLFSENFFAGIEHVSGQCYADGERIYLWQAPHAAIGGEWQSLGSVVVGWPKAADCNLVPEERRVRAAFIDYLDTIRVKPADFELHTNTWWTLPVPFSEADVLKDINALATGFAGRTGMFFDSFALDLGWSDPRSIWRVDQKNFPNEFRAINDRLRGLGAGLGLWVSPGSGYPPGLDNKWLEASGYEVLPFPWADEQLSKVACFALGGRYQREFKENLLTLVNRYGIRHVKLDYMPTWCDVPTHGHPIGIDSVQAIYAGLADVMDGLRAANPNIVLEPLCAGYPPSPWWLTKTPYVLGPYGDDVPYGRVASPEWMESLITARDIAYRRDREAWIMPTDALETIDIVRQSRGDFENLAVMAIGRGRWFISTYLKPELMTPQNWDFLAALMRWARANRQYLRNAEMIGGEPDAREAYGYMFHQHAAEKEIFCARNPWLEPRAIELPLCTTASRRRELRMIYPRRELVAVLEPGAESTRIVLAPYETVMLETVPVEAEAGFAVAHAQLPIAVEAAAPAWSLTPAGDDRSGPQLRFAWSGSVTIPAVQGAELCVVVEGEPAVTAADATLAIDHHAAQVRTASSAGQFGAAAEASPENWKWFIAPVTPGVRQIRVELGASAAKALVGIFVRGSTPAKNNPAPNDGPAFPTYRPDVRGWSQALLPLTSSPGSEASTSATDPGPQTASVPGPEPQPEPAPDPQPESDIGSGPELLSDPARGTDAEAEAAASIQGWQDMGRVPLLLF